MQRKKDVEAYNKIVLFWGCVYGLFLISLKLSVISCYFWVGHRLMGRNAPFIFKVNLLILSLFKLKVSRTNYFQNYHGSLSFSVCVCVCVCACEGEGERENK